MSFNIIEMSNIHTEYVMHVNLRAILGNLNGYIIKYVDSQLVNTNLHGDKCYLKIVLQ